MKNQFLVVIHIDELKFVFFNVLVEQSRNQIVTIRKAEMRHVHTGIVSTC